MDGRRDEGAVVLSAAVGAMAMIAHQVAGKATRDALFLSNFDIRSLPVMLSASAVFSIVIVAGASRLMTLLSPSRVIPPAFALSGLLQFAYWGLANLSPATASVLVYLHIAALGSVLVSGFWSMYNERLDPRSAKAHIGRVVGGATLGGLLGGMAAQAAARFLDLSAMLPLLGILHLLCGWAVLRLRTEERPKSDKASDQRQLHASLQTLKRTSYLRNLALLVLLATVSAALIDYVFKFWAKDQFRQGEPLLSFFAAFYMGVGVLTFLIQAGLSRRVLEKLGLAKTVAGLPAATALGAGAAMAFLGLGAAAFARGAESVMRNSLFRSGYELFFTPVPEREKRSTKLLIDVGAERMGDVLGGGIVLALLLLGSWANPVMLGLALLLSLLGLAITRSLDQGYVATLERSLLEQALELDLTEVGDRTTRTTMLRTMTGLDIRRHLDPPAGEGGQADAGRGMADPSRRLELLAERLESDPVLKHTAVLRSQDAKQILQLLKEQPILDGRLAPHVIFLLAWDQVAEEAIRCLRNIAPQISGQLIDALLDKRQDFAIRRRIPRILAFAPSQRSADGLLRALEDRRFEVRYQCGQAMSFMQQRNPSIGIGEDRVFQAVLREVNVDRSIWESYRLLDRSDKKIDAQLVDDVLRNRTHRGLEHVFTILSLVLPREPLKVAFKGLHTQDAKLRGTALEYLESVLPDPIRDKLWPLLERSGRPPKKESRPDEEILSELLRSGPSIETSLAEEAGSHAKPQSGKSRKDGL